MYSYCEINMPTKELVDYYKANLLGQYLLSGVTYAKRICDNLDAFIELSREEQIKFQFSGISLIDNSIEPYNVAAARRLRTKYSCIKIIQCCLKIEDYQKEIFERSKKMVVTPSGIGYQADYLFASPEVFTNLRSFIDKVHTIIENIKKLDIDDDFKINALKLFEDKVKRYYDIFNLDYKSISKKIENKSTDCFTTFLGIILFVVLFGLLTKFVCT